MKSASHPFHARSRLGLYYENVLKPALEVCVGEPLTKTSEDTDTMDFEGKTSFVELKSRSDQYHYTQPFIQREGWLIPSCKIARARQEVKEGKRVVFFYFWKAGKSLWRWDFSEDGLADGIEKYPEWHRDKQKHWYIKQHHWKRIY